MQVSIIVTQERISSIIANNLASSAEVVNLLRDVLITHYEVDGEGVQRLHSEFIRQFVCEFKRAPRLQSAALSIIKKCTAIRLVNKKVDGLNVTGEYVIAGKQVGGKLRTVSSEEVINPNELSPTEYNPKFVEDDDLWAVATILDWGKEKKAETRTDAEIEAEKAFNKSMNELKKILKPNQEVEVNPAVKLAALEGFARQMGFAMTGTALSEITA